MEFHLTPGQSKSIRILGHNYKLSCKTFKNHNHKNKPIYYYHDGMKDEDLVATVEGDDGPVYDSPYSNTVDGSWGVFREKITIIFTKENDKLRVTIIEE